MGEAHQTHKQEGASAYRKTKRPLDNMFWDLGYNEMDRWQEDGHAKQQRDNQDRQAEPQIWMWEHAKTQSNEDKEGRSQ